MVSVELLEMEDAAKQQANQNYNGNLSGYLRALVQKDIEQKHLQEVNQQKHDNYTLLQAVSFIFVATTLFLLPICLWLPVYVMILSGIGVTGGVLLIILASMTLVNRKKREGTVNIWS